MLLAGLTFLPALLSILRPCSLLAVSAAPRSGTGRHMGAARRRANRSAPGPDARHRCASCSERSQTGVASYKPAGLRRATSGRGALRGCGRRPVDRRAFRPCVDEPTNLILEYPRSVWDDTSVITPGRVVASSLRTVPHDRGATVSRWRIAQPYELQQLHARFGAAESSVSHAAERCQSCHLRAVPGRGPLRQHVWDDHPIRGVAEGRQRQPREHGCVGRGCR